ncbi:MAG: protein kinase [Armatimonadota bacterium]
MESIREQITRVIRYELYDVAPIEGGCGVIWKARDLLTGADVAIKTISERLLGPNAARSVRTFKKEAAVAARLAQQCRYIAPVLDLGLAGSVLYSVMPWYEAVPSGTNIDLGTKCGKISLGIAKTILLQVCEAVETAHANGIVHSDIAPQNILYDSSEHKYLLTDFGLLKILESAIVSAGSGSLLVGGRQKYFPDYVLLDSERISEASDVYALAVTFRVLLEGQGILSGSLKPTPAVVRILHEQRDAPDSVRRLLSRFIDGHRESDRIVDFIGQLRTL